MMRRIVLAGCLLGVVGAGASSAFASAPATPTVNQHQVCLVTSSDDHHRYTQDYCIGVNLPPVLP